MKKAQTSLEITVALACLFLLLLAGFRIMTWVTYRMHQRQVLYESTRTLAGFGSYFANIEMPEINAVRLNILGE